MQWLGLAGPQQGCTAWPAWQHWPTWCFNSLSCLICSPNAAFSASSDAFAACSPAICASSACTPAICASSAAFSALRASSASACRSMYRDPRGSRWSLPSLWSLWSLWSRGFLESQKSRESRCPARISCPLRSYMLSSGGGGIPGCMGGSPWLHLGSHMSVAAEPRRRDGWSSIS